MNADVWAPGLGAMLRNARRRARLTQEQLAGLSTVSVRAIRDLEQERVTRPRKETLTLLADAMRLDGTQRAALELAVDGVAGESLLGDVYGADLAPPPTALHPLAGRRSELHTLLTLLGTGKERLLTVVGVPGVGKSRLVQEAVAVIHDRDRTPVLWVTGDRLSAPGAARVAVSRPTGPQATLVRWVRSSLAQRPGPDGGSHEELVSVIRDRPTLLVLDGHEEAATTAPALLSLLRSCPRLVVLITARRPNPVPGSRLFPLAPLPVADPGDESALGLMLLHASHMRPDLAPNDELVQTLAEICHTLDGLPGALEAAASWLLLYSPEQLLSVARKDPLALVDAPASAPAGDDSCLSAALRDAVRDLPARLLPLLETTAALPRPWTTDEMSAVPLAQPPSAHDLHALLLRGLIRQVPVAPGQPPRFCVLNVVRRLAGSTSLPHVSGRQRRPILDTQAA
ncbi:UNVERIFIED_CONTAM: transcriptional regulator with XRE-family HTH domain [Streptomyces canus]|jgi:transcriptional regulator with XRE-family HTH domain